jgi:uncharacterized FlaG/YvyC family protein
MTMTTAVHATSGPVAPEFVHNRTAQLAGGDSAAAKPAERTAAAQGSAVSANGNSTASQGTSSGTSPAASPNGGRGEKAASITVNPTFRYDSESQRMVMMLRDQKSGAVVLQIPSEVALKQYEQAIKRVREEVATNHAAAGSATAPTPGTTMEAARLGVPLPIGGASPGSGPGNTGNGNTGNGSNGSGSGSPGPSDPAATGTPSGSGPGPDGASAAANAHHNVVV